jgi:L,D-peptidoglycan transpeptidase YkuD (ErfK/YbiS/YcfS/YnhG family)
MNGPGISQGSHKRVRKSSFSIMQVRRRPPGGSCGLLLVGGRAIPVALGHSGILADKREGDGATPRGRFCLVRLWWRADRAPRPRTMLPARRIDRTLAWCENPADRRYNQPYCMSGTGPGDRMWRDDHLYDLVIEISHNTRPRIAGRGSAVFVHVARPDRSATAGCVALAASDLRRLLARLGPRTRIDIRL